MRDGAPREPEPIEAPEESPSLPAAALAAGAVGPPETRGPVHADYGEIWKLSWPVTLSHMLASAVSLLDIAMVGHLRAEDVAAVGYASQFFFLSLSVLLAVGFACVALMARAIGSGDAARARRALAASLEVAVGTALVVIALVLAAPRALLGLLGAEEIVIEATLPYLRLVMGSSALLAVSVTLESGLRADKNTVTPMRIAFVVSVVKVGLNAVLIFGTLGFPRLELVGAGIATVVSQAVGVALFGAVVWRAGTHSPIALRARDFRQARDLLPEVVRVSIPSVGERLAMNLSLLVYFRVLAEYGTVAIAAYTVGIRVLSFSWIPGIGFGAAAATLVGQALGAGRRDVAVLAGWRSLRLALGVAVLMAIPCALAREPLARMFTPNAETAAALVPFLLCLALSQPFLQAHFALGGAHRGAGDTMTPFVAATLGNWALRVPAACLFVYVFDLSLVWVWYAVLMDHLMRAAWLTWSFRRGRWQT